MSVAHGRGPHWQHRVLRVFLAVLSRARARGPGVLALLVPLVFVGGIIGFALEARATHTTVRWHEALYSTFGLFTFAGNRFGYPHTPVLLVIYFLAPTISASALVGALLHLLEERAPLMLRRFDGHTIVGGLGNLGTTLSRDLQRHGHPFIGIERDRDNPEVASLRASGAAVVFVGDMTSSDTLRRARCERAARVFFTSPNDVANLDAAFHVRRIARLAGVREPPTIYAHVYDGALADALENQLVTAHLHDAPIVTFNSYRFAAKALIANLVRDRIVRALRVAPGVMLARTAWPASPAEVRDRRESVEEDRDRLVRAFRLEREPETGTGDSFAIVGVGRFGRSVLRELIDSTPGSSRFLVIERSRAGLDASMEAFTESERARCDVCIGDATQPAALAALEAFGPAAVLVCTDNDISNLRLALVLHRRDVKTVTRMFDLDASAELGRGLGERGIAAIGLARLFRTAIPILTHEEQLLACVNLDFGETPVVDHLFYLARVSDADVAGLGVAYVPLHDLPRADDGPEPPRDMGLVWHRKIHELSRRSRESVAG